MLVIDSPWETNYNTFEPNPSRYPAFGELVSDLRADGVRTAVFKQTRDATGNWADAPVEAQTATDLENSILSRARQLRVNTAQK